MLEALALMSVASVVTLVYSFYIFRKEEDLNT